MTTNPFEKRTADLVAQLAFGEFESDEEWRDLHCQLEELSVGGDGKLGIRFNGPPRWKKEEADCPDCGRHVTVEGVSFGEVSPTALSLHWSEDCPKHRRWRIMNIHLPRTWMWTRHPLRSAKWFIKFR